MSKSHIVDLYPNPSDLYNYFYHIDSSSYANYFSIYMSSWLRNHLNWASAYTLLDPSRTIVQGTTNTSWSSSHIKNSYLILVLHKIKLKITDYLLAQNHNSASNMFQAFKLEGSMNGNDWFFLDKQNIDDSSFFNTSARKLFHIEEKKFVRFLKLTQTAPNIPENNNNFIIGEWLLYGEVWSFENKNPIKFKKDIEIDHFSFLFVLIYLCRV